MAVQVNEFFSGFSLKLATYFLLWSILFLDSFLLWVYLYSFLYEEIPDNIVEILNYLLSENIPKYRLVGYNLGIITSLIGMVGIHKNMPKLLMCSIFYFLCYLLYYSLSMILMMIDLDKYNNLIWGEKDKIKIYLAPATFAYLFFIALMMYFACTVKSCMNDMLKLRSTNYCSEMFERTPSYNCEEVQKKTTDF